MVSPASEVIFSLTALVVSVLLFRFLATGGPRFVIIGDLDLDLVDRVFEGLMWLCGAVALFLTVRVIALIV